MSILDQADVDGEHVGTYVPVCASERLTHNRGVAALLDGHAVALFLLGDDELHVVDNVDPFSGASVLSRGIVGDVQGTPTIASPLYKQRFDLRSGHCIDDPSVAIRVHEARIVEDRVEVRVRS